MTPAEWLAALVLGWIIGSGVWQAVDSPVDRYYHSFFYMLATTCIECGIIFEALLVLGAGTGWIIAAVVLTFLAVSGVFMKIHNNDRSA